MKISNAKVDNIFNLWSGSLLTNIKVRKLCNFIYLFFYFRYLPRKQERMKKDIYSLIKYWLGSSGISLGQPCTIISIFKGW